MWEPEQSGLANIAGLLSQGLQPGANQAEILKQLDEWGRFPDFCKYLAYIFSSDQAPDDIRQSAGLLLKNNVLRQYRNLDAGAQAYIQQSVLPALGSDSKPLRSTAGTIVAAVVGAGTWSAWPSLAADIAQALRAGQPAALLGALDVVYKVAEEFPQELSARVSMNGDVATPSQALLPGMLALATHAELPVRRRALEALNLTSVISPPGMEATAGAYLQALFALAQEPDGAGVHKEVCDGMVQMVTAHPDAVAPHLPGIIAYLLAMMERRDQDADAALAACEFWSAFCEAHLDPSPLHPHLPRLVPLLLDNLTYQDDDDDVIVAEALEESAADRDAELKPFVPRSAAHGDGGGGEGGDDDGDGDTWAQWSLRKSSGMALDFLSNTFCDDLVPIMMPTVQARLASPDWHLRESALLALGAVSHGCYVALQPHLATLLATLRAHVASGGGGGAARHPLERAIACWSTSRFVPACLERAMENEDGALAAAEASVRALIGALGDANRRVQEAACGALAGVCEDSPAPLVAALAPAILDGVAAAARAYGRRATRHLYDAIMALADALAPSEGGARASPGVLAQEDNQRKLMPALMHKWRTLGDGDEELLPLLEVMGSVATAMGAAFEPFAPDVALRCVRLVEAHGGGQERPEAAAAGGARAVDPSLFVVCALDLLSCTCEALGPRTAALLDAPEHPLPLVDVAMRCAGSPLADVRQSAFAVVGDLARGCGPRVAPRGGEVVALAVACLAPGAVRTDTLQACNNAAWAAGETVLAMDAAGVARVAVELAEALARVLAAGPARMARSLLENSAVALGRVAWRAPEALAPHAAQLAEPWFLVLQGIKDGREKEGAFWGVCGVVARNAAGAAATDRAAALLLMACASWRSMREAELHAELRGALAAVRAHLEGAGRWGAVWGGLKQAARDKLGAQYGLR
ncbi:unnamed protein product [Pedinophyceae sp. YPF-701]|nr:unnamed protein product [Pedinophyceae sp. YPF-701]